MMLNQQWAVMRSFTDDRIHIVPIIDVIDDDGDIKPPHTLSVGCTCQPWIDDRLLIVHDEIQ